MPRRRGRKTSLHYGNIRRSLVDIAESAQRTFELMGAREEWRDRVKRWCAAVETLRFEREWSKLKKKHADKAKADKNLSNTQGNPSKDPGNCVVDEDCGSGVPEDLQPTNCPEVPEDILPLGERVLSLDEKYVLLAAIHDTFREDDDRIITEAEELATTSFLFRHGGKRENVERQDMRLFSHVREQVWGEGERPTQISLEDMDRLRGYLGDVEKDLLAKVTPIYDPAQVSERAASYAGAATAVLAAARENRKAGKFKEGIPDKWTWVCRSYDELRQSLWGYREFTALLTECDPRTEEFEFTRGETPGERLAASILEDWGESQLERLSQAANRLAAAVAAAQREAGAELRAQGQKQGAKQETPDSKTQCRAEEGYASVKDLAKVLLIPSEKIQALRKRLERMRRKHLMDCSLFIEAADQGKGQPRFLYNISRVRPHVEDLGDGRGR